MELYRDKLRHSELTVTKGLRDLFEWKCACCGAAMDINHLFYFSAAQCVLIVKDKCLRLTALEAGILFALFRNPSGLTAHEIAVETSSTNMVIKSKLSQLRYKIEPLGLTYQMHKVRNDFRNSDERISKITRYSLYAMPG